MKTLNGAVIFPASLALMTTAAVAQSGSGASDNAVTAPSVGTSNNETTSPDKKKPRASTPAKGQSSGGSGINRNPEGPAVGGVESGNEKGVPSTTQNRRKEDAHKRRPAPTQ